MVRANRSLAVALLFMAVLCSPAGVCVIDGMAATVQADQPAHAHACCKEADGTFLTASDGTCCSEPRTGFLNVLRFALEKQAPPPAVVTSAGWTRKVPAPVLLAFGRRAPLVLRI